MNIFTKSITELTVADIFLIVSFALVLFLIWYLLWKKGGLHELKKMWKDTLINKASGDYSLKRIGAALCLFNASLLTYCAIIKLNIHPNLEFGIDRSQPLLIVALTLINLAVALGATYQVLLGHLNARKTADDNGKPLTEPYTEPELVAMTEPLAAKSTRSKSKIPLVKEV